MGNKMKALAGIVLFNPDIERLTQNIAAILPQIDCIVCVDNGSSNLDEVKGSLPTQVVLIENGRNLGIAAALNRILCFADKHGYEWFLTLDQDSVCEDGLIDAYLSYRDLPSAAMLTCRIIDRNFVNESSEKADELPKEIEECITSASFCMTEALKAVGGFDEQMFIDSVDFDICMNLRKHGYMVYRIPFVGLLHEVGHGKNVRLLWKKRVVYNHSALRNYYIARNHVYMARKYPDDVSLFKTRIKELEAEILILLYEEDKIKKLRARRLGVKDAGNMRMGECTWL